MSDGRLDFVDERFAPRALAFRLEGVRAGVGGAASGFPEPVRIDADARLDSGGRLRASVRLSPATSAAEGNVSIEEFELAPWGWLIEPHLAAEPASGRLSARTAFRAAGSGPAPTFTLTGLTAELVGLALRQTWDRAEVLRIGSLKVEDGELDPTNRSLRIGTVLGSGGRLALARDRDGTLNLDRLLRRDGAEAAAPGPSGPLEGSAPSWRFTLGRFAVDNWDIGVTDAVAGPAADLVVSKLSARAEDLSTEARARGRIAVNANVGRAGSLALRGNLSLAPLVGRLRVDAQRIGLLAAQPWFTDRVGALVSSGSVTARGDLRFRIDPPKPPRAGFAGEVTVADLGVVTREGDEELLRWKSLHLGGIGFELDPLRVDLAQVALTDFFARVVLRSDGRLNLQDLVVRDAGAPLPAPAGTPATSGAAAGPSPVGATTMAPSAAADAPSANPLSIGRVTLANGEIDFTDRFIQPNFDAHLTGLTGSIGAMSADTAGDVELRGRIDESGSIEVAGRINPLARSAFVDLKARARGVDLPRASPYSVRYLGYGIERGKLSADVSYRLENRRLDARNNVVLDQLTFGDRVESPTATKLPVLFAVSLLKDRNGVIEVDLPIRGSIDDPEFSVGGLVLRMILNLIGKAITAPFSLLAGLGRGGEELSQVTFEAGRAELGAEARQRLETLARALGDRPALKVDLAGRVDPERDREALRRLDVERKVKAQKLRGRVASGADVAALDAILVDPAEYPQLLAQAYRAASFPKPRNAIGLVRDLPAEEMEKLLLVNASVDERALRELADQRANAVRAWLAGPGGIDAERLFVVAPKLTAEGVEAGRTALAVEMSLR